MKRDCRKRHEEAIIGLLEKACMIWDSEGS